MTSWLRRHWRQLRRHLGAHRRRNTRLREFVYLDETSVYSLSVSRLGPVASEFTESESSSLRSELNSSLGVSAGLKSDVGAKMEQTRGSSTQVVRRAIIQSTFRDLHEYEEDRLKLAGKPLAKQPSCFASTSDVEHAVGRLTRDGWLTDPADLVRGDLIELEVELGTELIHQFNVTLATMLELFAAHPELVSPTEHRDMEMAKAARTVFDRMLVRLVPVRGRAVDYCVLNLEGRDWIVRTELVDLLPAALVENVSDLHVVGVAEEALFWKDIRRVVFSRSRFTVMARLSGDGLSTTWTPAKLLDVLSQFFPEVVPLLEGAVDGLIQTSHDGAATDRNGGHLHAAIRAYAAALHERSVASHQPAELAECLGPRADAPSEAARSSTAPRPDTTGASPPAPLPETSPRDADPRPPWDPQLPEFPACEAAVGDVAAVREMFNQVADDLERHTGSAVDRTMARSVRDESLDAAGLEPDATLVMQAQEERPTRGPRAAERLLDSEIVAIYW